MAFRSPRLENFAVWFDSWGKFFFRVTMGRSEKQTSKQESVDIVNTHADGGWGWFVCFAGFIAQFTILGIQNNTGILYTSLLTEFKGSKGDTGTYVYSTVGILY